MKNKGKFGENWSRTLYFDPEADKASGADYRLTDPELIEKLKDLVDDEERILEIRLYKVPLYWMQVTNLLFYHAYIVLKTSAWWWSIEKNSEGITLQRSKLISAVVDKYRRKVRHTTMLRTEPVMMTSDRGKKTLRELIEFLYFKNELNKPLSNEALTASCPLIC